VVRRVRIRARPARRVLRTGVFELPDAGVEASGAFVGGEQVGLQGRAGDGGTGGCPRWRGRIERVDLFEEVAIVRNV
jgi:hypothetical protein